MQWLGIIITTTDGAFSCKARKQHQLNDNGGVVNISKKTYDELKNDGVFENVEYNNLYKLHSELEIQLYQVRQNMPKYIDPDKEYTPPMEYTSLLQQIRKVEKKLYGTDWDEYVEQQGRITENKSNMRKIRLNENQFNRLVAKCVKRCLNEGIGEPLTDEEEFETEHILDPYSTNPYDKKYQQWRSWQNFDDNRDSCGRRFDYESDDISKGCYDNNIPSQKQFFHNGKSHKMYGYADDENMNVNDFRDNGRSAMMAMSDDAMTRRQGKGARGTVKSSWEATNADDWDNK